MIGVKKKEDVFFDLFITAMDKICEAGLVFEDIIRNYTNITKKVALMKTYEVACDKNTHTILKVLLIGKTFTRSLRKKTRLS